MKKTLLSALAAGALILGGYASAFAQEPCCYPEENQVCYPEGNQVKEGFEEIGQGTKAAAVGSYETVKNGVETGYEKTKEGTVGFYEKAKEGTVNTYEKAKEGTVKLWNETKEKIHNATD